jgi:hypothetical protein
MNAAAGRSRQVRNIKREIELRPITLILGLRGTLAADSQMFRKG